MAERGMWALPTGAINQGLLSSDSYSPTSFNG